MIPDNVIENAALRFLEDETDEGFEFYSRFMFWYAFKADDEMADHPIVVVHWDEVDREFEIIPAFIVLPWLAEKLGIHVEHVK